MNASPAGTTRPRPIRKDRYEVGDIVQLLPDPYSPESGPDPRDFDMPAPVVMITAVETHTYNPDWVLGYDVREVEENDEGDHYGPIKPGKIARLILDGALIKRVQRAAARDHARRDPYICDDGYFYGYQDQFAYARRLREGDEWLPAVRPWIAVNVESVSERGDDPKHFASVEVTYGLGNPARALYGVGRDGHVYCWAD